MLMYIFIFYLLQKYCNIQMKIAVILDTRSANKEGKHPIKFRFTEWKKSVYEATGMFAHEDGFSSEIFFTGSDPNKYRLTIDRLDDASWFKQKQKEFLERIGIKIQLKQEKNLSRKI